MNCGFCGGRKFTVKSQWIVHMEEHRDNPPTVCPKCFVACHTPFLDHLVDFHSDDCEWCFTLNVNNTTAHALCKDALQDYIYGQYLDYVDEVKNFQK